MKKCNSCFLRFLSLRKMKKWNSCFLSLQRIELWRNPSQSIEGSKKSTTQAGGGKKYPTQVRAYEGYSNKIPELQRNFHVKPYDEAHDKTYAFWKAHDKISKPHDRNSVMRPLKLTLSQIDKVLWRRYRTAELPLLKNKLKIGMKQVQT